MRAWLPIVLSIPLSFSCAHSAEREHSPHAHPHVHHRFDDAERWARVFDDPERDAWQQPERIIEALALAADAKVADLGAGTGYFSVRLARKVPNGKVYAVDIEPTMVAHLDQRARSEGLANVAAVQCTADEARIPEPVDVVLIVDTYHHISERVPYFQRLAASLRPEGRIAVVDFKKGQPRGPPDAAKVDPEQVDRELAAAGFKLLQQHELPSQYFRVYARAPRS